MKKKNWPKTFHNYLGLGAAVFIAILSVSGVLLNHPHRLKNTEIQTLAAHPLDGQQLWMGRKDGLFFSIDGGKNWQAAKTPFAMQDVVSVALHPQEPRKIYALEKWGRLISSKNGGRFWRVLSLPIDDKHNWVELKQVAAGPETNIRVLTSHGTLYSRDEGKSWDDSDFNAEKTSLSRIVKMVHTGYFFGPKFFWLYDASSLALLGLIATGIYLWKIGRKNK